MKGRIQLTALAALAVVGMAFAQDDTTSVTTQTTSLTQGRSTLTALASILARRTPEESTALVHALEALQNKQGPSFGANTGYVATEQVMLNSLSGAEADTLRSAWNNMNGFDKESFLILARAAYFGGLSHPQNVGSERPLRVFSEDNMWRTNFRPMGEPVIPELAALSTVMTKLGAGGEAFKNALTAIENGPKERKRNMGYVNAQDVLMDHIDAGSRDTFLAAWNALPVTEREGALVLVRDAYWNGINDQ